MRTRVTFSFLLSAALTIGGANLAFTQTLPALPNIPDISCASSTPATSNATIRVPRGGNFQNALNSAKPGDTIILEAGATYTGNFVAPAKTGTGCITIRSSAPDSALPAAGQRTSPSYASLLPKIVSMSGSALTFGQAAHNYLLMHVEITAAAYADTLVNMDQPHWSRPDLMAHHLEFDRVYIHGHPTQGAKRGIAFNGRAMTVKNSHISDIKVNGADSQAVGGWAGGAHFRIINNYLEASGENIMFGGAQPWWNPPNGTPADIEIRNNHMFKPLSWMVGHPTYQGTPWSVKNLLELKNAKRVLIYGNVLENTWPHAQIGYAVLFTVRNQDAAATWSTVEDVTFTNNIVRRAAHGVSIMGYDNNYPSQQTKRILIQNNLFQDIGTSPFGQGPARMFGIQGGPRDIVIKNNTAFHNGYITAAGGGPTYGFVFQNNIVSFGQNGLIGDGTTGPSTLTKYFPSGPFDHNVVIAKPATLSYPPNNSYPASLGDVRFVDAANGNYRLSNSSPYKKAGTDGKDIGVDWDVLAAAPYTKPLPVALSPSTPTP